MVRFQVAVIVVAVAARSALAQPGGDVASDPVPVPAEPAAEAAPVAPDVTPPPPSAPSPYEQCLEARRAQSAAAQATSDLGERGRLLRQLPDCSQPGAMTAQVAGFRPLQESAIASGFAIEARLDAAQVPAGNILLPAVQAGLFVGYRGAAFSLGVGLELARVHESEDAIPTGSSDSETAILVLPGVRAKLARTRDEKTELLALADLGIGTILRDSSNSNDDPDNPLRLRLQLGVSLRQWLSRSFAVGASVGLRYDRISISTDVPGAELTRTFAVTGMFSSLYAVAVF